MKSRLASFCLVSLTLLIALAFKHAEEDTAVKNSYMLFLQEQHTFETRVTELSDFVLLPGQTLQTKGEIIRIKLRSCRQAYKKIEWIISYYYPSLVNRINGPDVMEEEEPAEFEPAHGLQVIENCLLTSDLTDPVQVKKIHTELSYLQTTVKGLTESASVLSATNSATMLAALKYELIRVSLLGFTEYDNPVQKNYLQEAIISLQSIQENLHFFDPKISAELLSKTDVLFNKSIKFIKKNNSFEKFNRLEFLVAYYIPLSQTLDAYTRELKVNYSSYNSCLNLEAASVFDVQSFNFYFNRKDDSLLQQRILLGRSLFFDPVLSGNLKRACASCHRPEKAFTDGLVKSQSFDQSLSLTRNSPTLINACMQTAFFEDSRETSLERQISAVINNPKELNTSFPVVISRLERSIAYKKMFQGAFPGDSISADHIVNAIADYERSLIGFNSNFDKYIQGDHKKLNASQINGFNLFMGKAKCGSCHFPPLFNGVLPPMYSKSDFEVIGTLESNDFINAKIDPDEGIGAMTKADHQKFGFKVPGLRNIALTAPYMHNGSMKTLEDVLFFYNKGGAAGFGIKLPNQTLSTDSLQLSKQQISDIIHFLGSLTDTSSMTTKSLTLPELSKFDQPHIRKAGGEY
jgi:cytochrome c peroxidase